MCDMTRYENLKKKTHVPHACKRSFIQPVVTVYTHTRKHTDTDTYTNTDTDTDIDTDTDTDTNTDTDTDTHIHGDCINTPKWTQHRRQR